MFPLLFPYLSLHLLFLSFIFLLLYLIILLLVLIALSFICHYEKERILYIYNLFYYMSSFFWFLVKCWWKELFCGNSSSGVFLAKCLWNELSYMGTAAVEWQAYLPAGLVAVCSNPLKAGILFRWHGLPGQPSLKWLPRMFSEVKVCNIHHLTDWVLRVL